MYCKHFTEVAYHAFCAGVHGNCSSLTGEHPGQTTAPRFPEVIQGALVTCGLAKDQFIVHSDQLLIGLSDNRCKWFTIL